MTIDEMRELVSLPAEASDAAVVAAYAALIDDGLPASITLVEPVTVEMIRDQCRLDDDEPEALILQKIRSAREWVEEFSGYFVAQQTAVAHFRSWGSALEIFRRPIVSVDAIIYDGPAGNTVYTDGAYSVGPYPLRILPGQGGFPTLRDGGRITVAYSAGFDTGEVKPRMIEAIMVLVAGMLSDREGAYAQSMTAAERLLKPRSEPAFA